MMRRPTGEAVVPLVRRAKIGATYVASQLAIDFRRTRCADRHSRRGVFVLYDREGQDYMSVSSRSARDTWCRRPIDVENMNLIANSAVRSPPYTVSVRAMIMCDVLRSEPGDTRGQHKHFEGSYGTVKRLQHSNCTTVTRLLVTRLLVTSR
jgi:hypothetical protein